MVSRNRLASGHGNDVAKISLIYPLRHILRSSARRGQAAPQVAGDAGASGSLHSNPARALGRAKLRPKDLLPPSREQFIQFEKAIREGGRRYSRDCADFVQFVAISGCRLSEAIDVTWRDVDFERSEITVRGDPIIGTKKGEVRRLPMIPELRPLLNGCDMSVLRKHTKRRFFLSASADIDGSRRSQGRDEPHDTSRLASLIRNDLDRKRCGYSYRFALTRTYGDKTSAVLACRRIREAPSRARENRRPAGAVQGSDRQLHPAGMGLQHFATDWRIGRRTCTSMCMRK